MGFIKNKSFCPGSSGISIKFWPSGAEYISNSYQ
jgi:hypothetical protein